MSGQDAADGLVFGGFRLDRQGLFRLDPAGNADPVALGSRALDLLRLLAKKHGEILSKDELIAAAWPDTAVEESNLTVQISALRRVLERNPGDASRIQTITGRGYRLAAKVSPAEQTEAVELPLAAAEKPSIAVLPFENMTGDPEQDYFVDGIVEEITTAITRFPWLFVITRNTSFAYKGRAVDVRQVARELGVRYVLEGSVRKAGNRVRITGQLIDTATSAHIWAERFDAALDDIFDLQDEVAAGVAGAIEPKLRLAEIARAGRKPTDRLDAHDLYLRAQAQAYKRSQEGLARSVELARRALERDPAYGPAMARIALSRGMQQLRHWIAPDSPEAAEGIRMARQAVIAARDDPWVLDLAGLALSLLTDDNDAALSAVDRAIALNPSFALAFGHRAVVLNHLNRPQEAIASAHHAIRLSPRDPAMHSFCSALGIAHLALGQYEEGLRWAEEALRENSGLPALRLKLSLCGHLGRVREAQVSLHRMREIGVEPTIAAFSDDLPKGLAPEISARLIEGLRKAGVPED